MQHFMNNVNERISDWRDLRSNLASLDKIDALKEIINWWGYAPLCKFVIDWDRPESWPDPWTLISDNIYCDTSLAFLMHQTIVLSEMKVESKIVRLKNESDEVIAVLVDNEIVINFSYRELVDIDHILENGYRITHEFQWSDAYSLISTS